MQIPVLVPNEIFMFILQVVDISLHILRFITSVSEISVTSNKKLSPWKVNHCIISSNLCFHQLQHPLPTIKHPEIKGVKILVTLEMHPKTRGNMLQTDICRLLRTHIRTCVLSSIVVFSTVWIFPLVFRNFDR